MIITIEEYEDKDMGDVFIFPAIPWKWTISSGSKIMTYGYTHTKEQAENASQGALRAYNQ